eukprot:Tbor_TRINITY_DN5628_c0_g1::TRINITY_DN5628_c0_g1_i1::g.8357::m.8357
MAQFPPPPLFDDNVSFSSTETQSTTKSSKDRLSMFKAFLEGTKLSMDTVRRYARSGIPESCRRVYWKVLIGFLPPTPGDWEATEKQKLEEYKKLLNDVCELDENGNVANSNDSHRIDVDIPRTLPTMHFFACEDKESENGIPKMFSDSQQTLRRILFAISALNRGLGYVQGMNELVAHFLITFSGGKLSNLNSQVESEAFFCFQTLLGYIGDNFCRELDFDKDMGVSNTIGGFSILFKFCDPELFKHMEACEVMPEYYAFRWITLLMTQEFSVPDVLRIWDFLLSFGDDLNYALYYTSVSMLISVREDLLQFNGMSQMLIHLQHYPSTVEVQDILSVSEKLIDTYGIRKLDVLKDDLSKNNKISRSVETRQTEFRSENSEGGDRLLREGVISNSLSKMTKYFRGFRRKSPFQRSDVDDTYMY